MAREHIARHAPRILALALALTFTHVAIAQTPPPFRPFTPPTYGVAQPALQGYELSQFANGFNFSFTVALSEIQKFLPAGYTALPTAAGGTTTGIAVLVTYNNLMTVTPAGGGTALPATYGPFETFDLAVGTLNPQGVFQSVLIARFVNNQEIVDLRNQFSGTIDTRYADIKVRVRKEAGLVRMKVDVDDPDFGLKVTAAETGSDFIFASPRNFPPLGLGTVNTTVSPPTVGRSSVFSFSADNSATFTDPAALDVTRQQVRLAGGKVKILGTAPGNFFFNQEVAVKLN